MAAVKIIIEEGYPLFMFNVVLLILAIKKKK